MFCRKNDRCPTSCPYWRIEYCTVARKCNQMQANQVGKQTGNRQKTRLPYCTLHRIPAHEPLTHYSFTNQD